MPVVHVRSRGSPTTWRLKWMYIPLRRNIVSLHASSVSRILDAHCHKVKHSATTTHGGGMQCASQRASIVPIANHRNERPGEAWVQYHSPRHNDCGLPDAFHCPSSCLGAWGNGMQNCFLHLSPGLSTSTPHYNEH